jgi:hypothetical protein
MIGGGLLRSLFVLFSNFGVDFRERHKVMFGLQVFNNGELQFSVIDRLSRVIDVITIGPNNGSLVVPLSDGHDLWWSVIENSTNTIQYIQVSASGSVLSWSCRGVMGTLIYGEYSTCQLDFSCETRTILFKLIRSIRI